mgnify:CR=1 FL=1
MVAELGRSTGKVGPRGYVGGVQAVIDIKKKQREAGAAESEEEDWFEVCNKEEALEEMRKTLGNAEKTREGAEGERRRKTEEKDEMNRGGRSEQLVSKEEFTQVRASKIRRAWKGEGLKRGEAAAWSKTMDLISAATGELCQWMFDESEEEEGRRGAEEEERYRWQSRCGMRC